MSWRFVRLYESGKVLHGTVANARNYLLYTDDDGLNV